MTRQPPLPASRFANSRCAASSSAPCITLLFTAANVYLGLKLGITFATSIPAAVISMAVLRFFANSTIQENNIVQTIASAAGTLSAIIFVLPGLIMVGWWTGFPFWLSVAVIALGGILGVMYSVPLRRALVTGSDLPYPEGVAAAEVLKVGAGVGGVEENKRGLAAIVLSSIVSAAYALLAQTKLVAAEAARSFQFGAGATTVTTSLSMALIGVGHLVGLAVGIAMLVGLMISWFVLVPWQTGLAGIASAVELERWSSTVFRAKVRFIGAGTIGVAAIWTLLKIIGPIIKGVTSALAASRARKHGGQDSLALTERDIPIGIIGVTILGSMIPIGLLLVGLRPERPDRRRAGADHRPEPALHPHRRGDHRRHHRLHGRPDRRLEQPGLGRRHPRRARDIADPRRHFGERHRRRCVARAWSPSPCSSPRSSSASRRLPTTICRISRPANWSARRRGGSRSR